MSEQLTATRGGPAPRAKPTDRQLEVLQAIANGKTVEDVAGALGLTAQTVRTHLKNAMTIMEAHSRAQAVAMAFRKGWLR